VHDFDDNTTARAILLNMMHQAFCDLLCKEFPNVRENGIEMRTKLQNSKFSSSRSTRFTEPKTVHQFSLPEISPQHQPKSQIPAQHTSVFSPENPASTANSKRSDDPNKRPAKKQRKTEVSVENVITGKRIRNKSALLKDENFSQMFNLSEEAQLSGEDKHPQEEDLEKKDDDYEPFFC